MKRSLISSDQLQLSLVPLGARIAGLKYRGTELALCYADDSHYLSDSFYLGASVGPIANRIAHASLNIHNKSYHLPQNEGAHCLHSGGLGFDRENWNIVDQSSNSITFELDYTLQKIGMQGHITILATYRVVKNSLRIDYLTTCDEDTYINPTNHVYLNLSGRDSTLDNIDISDHSFKLYGQNFVGVDNKNIPNGQLHEFQSPLHFKLNNMDVFDGLVDHHFNVKGNGSSELKQADEIVTMLEAKSEHSGITLHVRGNSIGYQFYTGHFLSKPFPPSAGFCVETQYAPDAINQPYLYSPVLPAGITHKHTTIFEFSGGADH